MNSLMLFENQEFGIIKTVCKDGEPIFLANPLSTILGYTKTNGMLRRLDEDEKIEISSKEVSEILGCTLNELGISKYAPSITFITESGLYNAILGSDKKEAKQFKRWVTSEVLPQIRKTGSYQSQQNYINEFKGQLTTLVNDIFEDKLSEIKEYYKIKSKSKSDISSYIKKRLGILRADDEYEQVKARVFLILGITKWEDLDLDNYKTILPVIDESIRIVKLDRPQQIAMWD